jgi:hypothetical protein
MPKNISEQRRTEYDYTELMRSQCEALGWCNDCSFDESDARPNVDHRRTEYGAELVACYYDGEWSPIKIFPEDTGGFPLTINEAREMTLRLHMATCAAQYYQDRMDALYGDEWRAYKAWTVAR